MLTVASTGVVDDGEPYLRTAGGLVFAAGPAPQSFSTAGYFTGGVAEPNSVRTVNGMGAFTPTTSPTGCVGGYRDGVTVYEPAGLEGVAIGAGGNLLVCRFEE